MPDWPLSWGICFPPMDTDVVPGLGTVRVRVKVNAGAQSESVRELADGTLQVRTRAPAIKGKANARVTELLARHFDVADADVVIVAGHTSPVKHVEIAGR